MKDLLIVNNICLRMERLYMTDNFKIFINDPNRNGGDFMHMELNINKRAISLEVDDCHYGALFWCHSDMNMVLYSTCIFL